MATTASRSLLGDQVIQHIGQIAGVNHHGFRGDGAYAAVAQEAVDCVFSSIAGALKKADTVTLVGFGSFKVVERKARKGRNPQTGEEIEIKASKAPKFTPGQALKEAVN